MRKGNEIELLVEGIEFPAKGFGFVDGLKVYAKNTFPGQKVFGRVTKKRKEYAEIRVSEVREKASYEEDQKCPHFGVCGGCSSQTIPYEKQLELKVEQVKDLFKEAEVPTGEFLGIETSPIQWEYRNKMEYTFGDEEKGGELTLGMHMKGKSFGIVNVDKCVLVDEDFRNILDTTVKYFREKGGAMGYFSYDIGRVIEDMPKSAKDDVCIPDSYFLFYDNVIIFDLRNQKTYITALGIKEESEKSIANIYERIKDKDINLNISLDKNTEFSSNFSREEYINSVKKVKEYIKEGHTYIANLTQRFSCDFNSDPFDTYISLRSINKAPFSCYLNLDGFQIISSSPERFLKVFNNKVETRPIKGTRPRGKDKLEDEKNKKELLNSEKDKSELLMIVDLERND